MRDKIRGVIADTLIIRGYDLNKENFINNTEETYIVNKINNPNDTLIIFFPEDIKVGVNIIRDYIKDMEKDGIKNAIIIVKEIPTTFFQKKINETQGIEYFIEKDLIFNILEHELVPKHVLISQEEKIELFLKYGMKEKELQRISKDDPVSKRFGVKKGDIFKIIRNTNNGEEIAYRIVN